jgi:peptidoglycan hydrolase-like protein with peptidoglycan-binding domain
MEQASITHGDRSGRPSARRWIIAAVVAGVLAVSGTAFAASQLRGGSPGGPGDDQPLGGQASATTSTLPAATTTTTTSPPTTTTRPKPKPKPKPLRKLTIGDKGADVDAVQKLLLEQGYFDLEKATGVYDPATRSAVMAYQKVNKLERDGVAGPKTQKHMRTTPRAKLKPKSAEGAFHVETDLTRQVTYLVTKGEITGIINISSASGGTYTSEGELRRAVTPTGQFQIERKINGWRKSKLGLLYRPAYFVGGYAYHGSYSVPGFPASHGCIRVAISTMDRVYDKLAPGTKVLIYRT